MTSETNALVEGWGAPVLMKPAPGDPPFQGSFRQVWHYYAGVGGLGGRFNSLCQLATFPNDGPLFSELPWISQYICGVCNERKASADKHAPR